MTRVVTLTDEVYEKHINLLRFLGPTFADLLEPFEDAEYQHSPLCSMKAPELALAEQLGRDARVYRNAAEALDRPAGSWRHQR